MAYHVKCPINSIKPKVYIVLEMKFKTVQLRKDILFEAPSLHVLLNFLQLSGFSETQSYHHKIIYVDVYFFHLQKLIL